MMESIRSSQGTNVKQISQATPLQSPEGSSSGPLPSSPKPGVESTILPKGKAYARWAMFLLLLALPVLGSLGVLSDLSRLSLGEQLYSHLVLIPLVSAYFLWTKRGAILERSRTSWKLGSAIFLLGAVLRLLSPQVGHGLAQADKLAVGALSLVLCSWGAFLLCFGGRAWRAASFPLIFLIFMVPLPSPVLGALVAFLQRGSTEAANALFQLSGVPFLREGFVFRLPGTVIEVAPQCSGIRSGLALLITSVLAGQLFLNTWWARASLALAAFPIAMFKNGLRIVSLSLLGVYVDPRVLDSELHRSGGIPFFAVALAMMAPVLLLLHLAERRRAPGAACGAGP